MANETYSKLDQYLAEESLFQTNSVMNPNAPNFRGLSLDQVNQAGIAGKLGGAIMDAGKNAGDLFQRFNRVNTADVVREGEQRANEIPPVALDKTTGDAIAQDLLTEVDQQNIQAAEQTQATQQTLDPEQMHADMQTQIQPANKYSQNSSINLARSNNVNPEIDFTTQISDAENDQQVLITLDAAGKQFKRQQRMSQKELDAHYKKNPSAVYETLKPILTGDQKGLMNAEQQYAARILLLDQTDRLIKASDFDYQTANKDDLANFANEYKKFNAMFQLVNNNASELGRGLAQQNIIPKGLNAGSMEDIDKALAAAGGDQAVSAYAAALKQQMINATEGDAATVPMLVKERLGSFERAAREYWMAQILSGAPTQAVNITSNAVWGGWETYVQRPVAGIIGDTKKLINPNRMDGVTLGETQIKALASIDGIFEGLGLAARAFLKDESIFGGTKTDESGDVKKFMDLVLGDVGLGDNAMANKIASGVEAAALVPFRALTTGDEFFKTINFKSELAALAYRDAIQKGLDTREEINAHIETVMRNPSADIYNKAIEESKDATFTSDNLGGVFGAMAAGAQELSQKNRIFGWLFPFISTPSNVMAKATELSALSVLSPNLWKEIKAGGARADHAQARMALGLTVSAAVYALYKGGFVTGSGSKSKELNDALDKGGWQANSVKINDTHIDISRFEPLAASFSMITNLMDYAHYSKTEKEFQEYMLYAGFGLAEHITDAPMMSGLSSLMDAVRYQNMDAFVANYVGGLVPYSGFRKAQARTTDIVKRVHVTDSMEKDMVEKFKQRLDYTLAMIDAETKQDLRPARYWDGTVITDSTEPVYMNMGIKTNKAASEDPINNELIANHFAPSEPSHAISFEGVKFSLIELDKGKALIYDALVKSTGEMRRTYFTEIMTNEKYRELEAGIDSQRAGQLKAATAKADSTAREVFIANLQNLLKQKIKEDKDSVSSLGHFIAKHGIEKFVTLARTGQITDKNIPRIDKKIKVIDDAGNTISPNTLNIKPL